VKCVLNDKGAFVLMDSEETDGAADSNPPIFGDKTALSHFISVRARLEEITAWTDMAAKAHTGIYHPWQSREEKPA
jgi:hypothetical protein